MTINSQNDQVLAMLKKAPLTSLGAIHILNCLRLSARIYDLREMGHQIETVYVETHTGKRIARYTLNKLAKRCKK